MFKCSSLFSIPNYGGKVNGTETKVPPHAGSVRIMFSPDEKLWRLKPMHYPIKSEFPTTNPTPHWYHIELVGTILL